MPYSSFPDGVVVAGPDGRILQVNDWIVRWMRGRSDLIGMHIGNLFPLDDRRGNTWIDVVRPYDGLAIRKRINEQVWYSPRGNEYLITAALERDRPAGKVQRLIVCVRSAANRHQIDRRKSDMVATVAHELRSPLTGIKGFSATLLSRWDAFSDDQKKFMLETIDADADRLSRLVTELLDAARIDSGRLSLRTEPVHADELAARVLRSAFATSAKDMEPNIIGDIPVIWGDSDRLIQVLTNLVENAVRHGEGLDAVEVEAAERDGKTGVELRVLDSGPGIPEDARERVFSRFWRAGPGAGSGLGMFIVAGVVDLHGGTIDIDTSPTAGTMMRVWLPVNEPASLRD